MPDSGGSDSFTLYSSFKQVIRTPPAGNAIAVAAHSCIALNVTFDLAGFFNRMRFSTGAVEKRRDSN